MQLLASGGVKMRGRVRNELVAWVKKKENATINAVIVVVFNYYQNNDCGRMFATYYNSNYTYCFYVHNKLY